MLGESPIVDVQSARRQQVIDGDVLQAIPTSRSYNNVLQLVPGVVAGDGQVQLRPAMLLFTAHGGNAEDGRLTVDGINTGASRGGAGVSGYIPDMQNTAEITVHHLGQPRRSRDRRAVDDGRPEVGRQRAERLVLPLRV